MSILPTFVITLVVNPTVFIQISPQKYCFFCIYANKSAISRTFIYHLVIYHVPFTPLSRRERCRERRRGG